MIQNPYTTIYTHARNNDFEKVKECLSALNLRKNPNVIKDIYYHFKHIGESFKHSLTIKFDRQELLDTLLIHAVKNNNTEFYKYIIESKELRVHPNFTSSITWGHLISTGNLAAMEYLVNLPINKDKASLIVHSLGYLGYVTSCLGKDILKYLIDDPKMPLYTEINKMLKEEISPEGNFGAGQIFVGACSKGNKIWVDFLLASKEYKHTIDNKCFVEGIKNACGRNSIEMVRYLLTDKNMPYKPYADYEPARLLQIAAKQGHIDMLQYLICDFNLPRPQNTDLFFDEGVIAHHVESFRDMHEISQFKKNVQLILELFDKQEMYNNLHANLKRNENAPKPKRKI